MHLPSLFTLLSILFYTTTSLPAPRCGGGRPTIAALSFPLPPPPPPPSSFPFNGTFIANGTFISNGTLLANSTLPTTSGTLLSTNGTLISNGTLPFTNGTSQIIPDNDDDDSNTDLSFPPGICQVTGAQVCMFFYPLGHTRVECTKRKTYTSLGACEKGEQCKMLGEKATCVPL